MSIEFDCDKCGKLSDRYIILCPTCATGNTVGTQPTDVQQLKAEIAALANELDYFNFHRISKFGAVDEIVAKMRQLSAV